MEASLTVGASAVEVPEPPTPMVASVDFQTRTVAASTHAPLIGASVQSGPARVRKPTKPVSSAKPDPLPDAIAAIEEATHPVPPSRPAGLASLSRTVETPLAAEPARAVSERKSVPEQKTEPAPRSVRATPVVAPPLSPRVPQKPEPEQESVLSQILSGIGALAYAPDLGTVNNPSGRGSDAKSLVAPGLAVYDISAHTVHLPGGGTLEAHSGLGPYFDNPDTVNIIMRGATPPAVYDLKLREALFHGVQALRLTPVSGTVHGRVGLLAHTCMLGADCASNGCVAFRDYDKFLKYFMEGRIRRLVVVPGNRRLARRP
jgi:hypothetical protein